MLCKHADCMIPHYRIKIVSVFAEDAESCKLLDPGFQLYLGDIRTENSRQQRFGGKDNQVAIELLFI